MKCCARRDAVAQDSATTAVGSGCGAVSGGTGRAGLGDNGSQGTGRAQSNGHTRAAAGTGGSADGGVGLWNSGHGRRALEPRARVHGNEGAHGRGLWRECEWK